MKTERKLRFWLAVSALLLITLSEVAIFHAIYDDIWVLNRYLAHPDHINADELAGIYSRTLQNPSDSHLYQKLVNLATLYQQLNDNPRVIVLARRALELHPENQQMRLYLANALRDTGHYAEAAKEYEQLLGKKTR